jgi:HlyD family secretion protein
MHKKRMIIPIILLVLASLASYWFLTTRQGQAETGELTGSGTVEATIVTISPETFGRVIEVLVTEGDRVSAGTQLFRLDDTLLSAQLQQAQVNLDAAMAGLEVAQAGHAATQAAVSIAQAQYELALAQALQQVQPVRSVAWQQGEPSEFDQPSWYYTHAEQLAAALDEMNASRAALEAEQAGFKDLTSSGTYTGLTAAETRLAQARAAFLDAQMVLERSLEQDDQVLVDAAQQAYDAANDELEAAQDDVDALLDSQAGSDIIDARARLAVAQERYDTAQDRYNALLTGKDSLQVQIASASIAQAQANVTLAESKLIQAQITVGQAQAALDVLNVQMNKLMISSPLPGMVLSRNIEPGEVIQPGASALTLGGLDHLTITVYIPEDRYGEVQLGDQAQVNVDSFPGITFTGTITRIADQAEFTPRNVQTVEGRSSTVFAIQLAVEDPGGLLKPGMPADVTFIQP